MTSDESAREALSLIETFVANAVDNLLANAHAIEAHPADRHLGARVQSDLILLERLYAVRAGLRDA